MPTLLATQNSHMRRSKILCAGAVGTALLTCAHPRQAFAQQPALNVKICLPMAASELCCSKFRDSPSGMFVRGKHLQPSPLPREKLSW